MSKKKIRSAGGKEFTVDTGPELVGVDEEEIALSWTDGEFPGGDALFAPKDAARLAAALVQAGRKDGVALFTRPERAGDVTVLTEHDWKFLSFALDMAGEEMSVGDGFTEDDRESLEKLRRLVEGDPS